MNAPLDHPDPVSLKNRPPPGIVPKPRICYNARLMHANCGLMPMGGCFSPGDIRSINED